MTSAPPIFVVGLPRSGTTLLTAMLGAHSRMDSGPETHFFTWLRRARLERILDPRRWPADGRNFVASIILDGTPVHRTFEVGCDEIDAFLASKAPSAAALLESLTAVRAARHGKGRWIEKTPNHLLHVDQIRAVFPDAKIVRIIRDPRDVAVSLKKVPFGSRSALANLYSWVERDERSWRFFERDPQSISVRYEDLVNDPRGQIERLCAFLGEPFEEAMLVPQRAAEGVISAGEWWKENVRGPVNGSRVQAWRREVSEGQQTVAALVCAEALARYGYPDAVVARQTLRCQPLDEAFIERNEAALIDLGRQGIRLAPWDARSDLPDVAWGRPGQLRWSLGKTSRDRARSALSLAARLLITRARGQRIDWIHENSGVESRTGLLEGVCDLALRATARTTTSHVLSSRRAVHENPDTATAATIR